MHHFQFKKQGVENIFVKWIVLTEKLVEIIVKMFTLEYRLEKAEKDLKKLQEEVDEKKKEDWKYRIAEWSKKDKSLAEYRRIFVRLDAAKANVQRLKTKIYNKQIDLLSVARQTHKTVENTEKDY
jgi:mannitol-specific phosphotransferase system IIBC component